MGRDRPRPAGTGRRSSPSARRGPLTDQFCELATTMAVKRGRREIGGSRAMSDQDSPSG